MAEVATPVETEPTPVTTAGEPTPVTEPAPVSTPSPEEVPVSGAREVDGGVAGYLERKQKALESGGKPPAEAATPPPEEPVVPPVPPVDEVPPVEPAPPVEPVAPPVEPVTPPVEDKKRDRVRVGGLSDGHLVVAATDIAREEGIPFAVAFARVSGSTTPPPAAPPAETPSVRSRADVENEMTTAREERRAAAASADALEQGAAGKMVAAEERIEALRLELEGVTANEQAAERERQNAEEAAFGRAVSESKAQAVQYWPDAGVEDSEFSQRMLELSDKYEKDPRLAHHVYEADAPFFFAELVAKERGLLPVHLQAKPPAAAPAPVTPPAQPATPPATKPAPVNQRAVIRPVQPAAGPASGAARTTQEVPKVDHGIDKIRSVADYERVKKSVLRKPENVRVS